MQEINFTQIDLRESLHHPPIKPGALVGGFFVERNLNMVSGQPGSFKTVFMLEVCSAISLGRPAFGLFPTVQGRVVFITGDDPPEVVIDRLLMLNAEETSDGQRRISHAVSEALATNLTVIPIDRVMTPRNRRHAELLRSAVEGASFAVLDPLRHFIGAADENVAHEVYEQVEPIRKLANDENCAIVVVHHAKKDSGGEGGTKHNGFRGSSALRGLTRAALEICRTNHGVLPARIAVSGENRYHGEPEPLALEIAVSAASVVTFSSPRLIDSLYDAIKESKKGLTTTDLITAFVEPAAAIRAALNRLKSKGLITSHKQGKVNMYCATARVSTSPSVATGPIEPPEGGLDDW